MTCCCSTKNGWVEARNATAEDFGIEGVAQVLRASGRSPAGISYQNLLKAVHASDPVQQDAVTLVVVHRLGVNDHATEWGRALAQFAPAR